MNRFGSVKVIGNDSDTRHMFLAAGYDVIPDVPTALKSETRIPDLVCFTGGEDVNPALYNEERHPHCGWTNSGRDDRETKVFNMYKGIPKVGICRGGQFLNIMSGGAMWQNVNNHGRSHKAVDLLNQRSLDVYSSHHQMMIAGDDGEVVCVANESTLFEDMKGREKPQFDTEVVYYETTRSLCFQPHPEWVARDHECRKYFFELIDKLL